MTPRWTTVLIVIATVIVWAVREAYVLSHGYDDATFSSVIRSFCMSHPILTLWSGIVIGHLLWQDK